MDSMPLYRQSKAFERLGLTLNDSTLDELFHRSAESLEPIAKRIHQLIRQADYINADETTIRMQDVKKCKINYMWTFLAPEKKLVGFVMGPGRSADVVEKYLGDSNGFLQCDAYKGYNSSTQKGKRHRVSCLSHIRRGFFSCIDSAPVPAKSMMEKILQLYMVEREAAELKILGSEKHKALRNLKSRPVYDDIEKWLAEQKDLHPPKSKIAKAINYASNNWGNLLPIFDDPKIRLDNNLAENALRVIALGRKNFLFIGSKLAGRNLAILQTLVSTCQMNKVNPQAYIADVLIKIRDTDPEDIDSLLPANWLKAQTA